MVVKKKVIHHKPTAPVEESATEVEETSETPTSPMQVVEVVEEGATPPVVSVAVPTVDTSTTPSQPAATPGETPVAPALEENKRREIEELFQPTAQSTTTPTPQPNIMPEISMHKKGTSKAFLFGLAAALLVVIFVGGGALVVTQGSIKLPGLAAKPTPTPTTSPTPIPTPITTKREELTIQVLNGGGTPGAAGKMKAFLEGKGYKVASTGNTEEYTYETTEIWVKASKAVYLSLLEEDFKGEYTVGTASATLSESAPSDARVIVGKK